MVEMIYGASGTAPLPNQSVTSALILDGAATDTKIGNRTADDTTAHASLTGTLTQLLSLLSRLVKGITGESSALTAPDITLAATATAVTASTAHIANVSNPHATTAAQVGALSNALGITSYRAGTFAARPTAAAAGAGATYIATDASVLYYSNGSSWSPVPTIISQTFSRMEEGGTTAIADIIDDTFHFVEGTGITLSMNSTTNELTITNSAPAAGSSNAFGTVAVSGSSNVVADSASDTLTIVAGHGVDITTSAGSDSVTVAVDETELDGSNIPNVGINNTNSYAEFAASGSNSLTYNVYEDLVTWASLPAGTYFVHANLYGSISDSANSATFRLLAGATEIESTVTVGAEVDFFTYNLFPTWQFTIGSTTTVKIQGKMNLTSLGTVEVYLGFSTAGYVKLS
jgi:hypothetical protein